jgi:hypothetical protein
MAIDRLLMGIRRMNRRRSQTPSSMTDRPWSMCAATATGITQGLAPLPKARRCSREPTFRAVRNIRIRRTCAT